MVVFTFLQRDSVEEELIRHHHSTGKNSQPEADDTSNQDDSKLKADDREKDTLDDDDGVYDITVGDVIYDVLLTLRDHPEIVKELIESKF